MIKQSLSLLCLLIVSALLAMEDVSWILIPPIDDYQAIEHEKLAQQIKEESTLYLKSAEEKLIPLPRQFLSADFIQRLQGASKHLLSQVKGKLTIDCRPYSYECLQMACEIALHEETVKITSSSLNKEQITQKVIQFLSVHEEKVSYAKNLLRALRLLGVSTECFGHVLKECQRITTLETQKLFYTCEEFYQALQEENIKSLSESAEDVPSSEEGALVRHVKTQLTLSPQVRRQIAFSMALKQAQQDPTISYLYTIDQKSWQDLELFCGSKSSPHTFFANTIDNTSSELGKVLLYGKLLQATTNTQELQRKQDLIRYLISEENKNTFDELDRCFKEFFKNPAYENTILSLFGPSDFFRDTMLKYQEINIPHLENLSRWLNTHEISVLIGDSEQIILTCANKLKRVAKMRRILLKGVHKEHLSLLTKAENIGEFLSGCIIPRMQGRVIEGVRTATVFTGTMLGGAVGFITSSLVSYILSILHYTAACPADTIEALLLARICMQQKLIWLAEYISFLKKVNALIAKLPLLKEFIPSLKTLNLKNESPERNAFSYIWHYFTCPADFETFINNIKVFDPNQNSMFKHFTARVLATYRLIDLHKEKFFNPIMAIAELDTYLSLARLYKQAQGKPNTFSFPQYLQTNKPCIDLTNFWNPAVGGNAVANSLTLGLHNHPKDIIITGPNAGGKSTLMRALIYTLLMGQSYGIVPAQEGDAQACFTPFANIRAYLNITDDPAKERSLFQVSIQRAQELLQSAEQATPQAFSLTLFDELYNGTKPEIAESLAFGTLKYLSTLAHNSCIASTHFPCVEKLQESTGTSFAYYKLASRNSTETRHKLLPGVYNEFNGFELAQEAQLPQSVVIDSKNYHFQKFGERAADSFAMKFVKHLLKNLKNESLETLTEVTTIIVENKGLCTLFHELIFTPPYKNLLPHLIEKYYQLSPHITSKLINTQDSEGKTLLHHAVIHCSTDQNLIVTLLKYGANIYIRDEQGKASFEYAVPKTDIYKILYVYQ